MRLHPVVDQAAGHASVEGQEIASLPNDGDIGDAAEVQDRHGLAQVVRQGAMIDRHQRSPLPARRDIGAAQIANYRNSERSGERRAVADLPRPAPFRPMRDRVAVKADDRDVLSNMAAAPEKV